ncbi:hypothetical protein [Hahella sp. CCB-MM4]|uniref:hypothetical protein n=1 Tax=Hahella sp. (strain CCB-MM4) TaxID=1926491 RepID=UPI00143D222C|nr:hypothetical protein [Hahella sp. CCB-MM4]
MDFLLPFLFALVLVLFLFIFIDKPSPQQILTSKNQQPARSADRRSKRYLQESNNE